MSNRPVSCKLYAVLDGRAATGDRSRRLERRRTRTPGISQERFSYTGPSGSTSTRNQDCCLFIRILARATECGRGNTLRITYCGTSRVTRIQLKPNALVAWQTPWSGRDPALRSGANGAGSKRKLVLHRTGKLPGPVGEHFDRRYGGELERNVHQESLSIAADILQIPRRAGQRTRGVEQQARPARLKRGSVAIHGHHHQIAIRGHVVEFTAIAAPMG